MQWRLLQGLPDQDIREFIALGRRRRFGRNEVVFHRDDPGDSLHLIEKGRFAIRVMTPLGDTVTIAVRGPGDSLGEMALVADTPRRTATVVALERAETLAVYRDDFDRLRRKHPAIDAVMLAFLVSELGRLNERLLEALYLPVEKRVLRRLDDLTALYPAAEGGVTIAITQEALAGMAGATRSTVNQVLRREASRGVLELERGRIRVLDRGAVAARAR
jgi:CRP-like cAMP-binding protein